MRFENRRGIFLDPRCGQSLVEILVGMAIGISLIIAGIGLIAPALNSNKQVSSIQTGTALARELLDNTRVWSEKDWHNIFSLATGTGSQYYLNTMQSPYIVATGTEVVAGSPVTSGLVGWWKFNEGTGTLAYDFSGGGNNGSWSGTKVGTSGYYSAGKIGSWAGAFDGNTDIVSFSATSSNALESLSLYGGTGGATGNSSFVAWVYPTSYSASWDGILLRMAGFDYVAINPTEQIECMVHDNIGNVNLWPTSVGIIPLNSWTQIAVVLTGGTGAKIYINGALDSSDSYAGLGINNYGGGTTIGVGDGSGKFPGLIDDLRIYNRALSSTEISQIYNSTIFTRYFYVNDAYRDGSGNITTSGGTYDPSTKLITVAYSWPGAPTSTMSMYLTRNEENIYLQSDWSGGPGASSSATSVGNLFATSTNIDYSTTTGSIYVAIPGY